MKVFEYEVFKYTVCNILVVPLISLLLTYGIVLIKTGRKFSSGKFCGDLIIFGGKIGSFRSDIVSGME